MTRKHIAIVLPLLLVALVLSSGCNARRPQLEFSMITELNLDGSGVRIFRVLVSQSVLDQAQSIFNDKEAAILDILGKLKPDVLSLNQTFLTPNSSGTGKYVDFAISYTSIPDLQEKLTALAGKEVRLELRPLEENAPSPFETRLRLIEANHMVEYFGWVTDALQVYFKELQLSEVTLQDIPVSYEIRVPGKLERSQVGQMMVVFHKSESSFWTRAYQNVVDTFSRQASRFRGTDGVSYSTRGLDLYEVAIVPTDFTTGVLYTEFLARVAVERLVIRTRVLPAPWWKQVLGSHPAGYQREMIVEFPEHYRAYIDNHRAEFSSFFSRYISDGIRGEWVQSGNRLGYRLEFGAIDEVSMRELSYRIVDQNKLRVREVRSSVLRSLGAMFAVLNPSNWGYNARTILTDILTRRIEFEEALQPVNWLTSATVIKDVVYEMHFPYKLEGVSGSLTTAVVAEGQRSFAYSWPAQGAGARHVVFHARAWDAPAVMGGLFGLALFPYLLFVGIRALWTFLKNNVFLGALQTAATTTGRATRSLLSLPVRLWSLLAKKRGPRLSPTNDELPAPPKTEDQP